ncbi:MAG: hypothetical protein ACYCX4_14830 [Bacillota bacterium]
MAVNEHPVFVSPEDPNIIIWRYMDFARFVSFIHNNTLFFSRSDCLGDPYEGSFSRANEKLRQDMYKDLPENVPKMISAFYKKTREFTFVNCWHMNSFESDAMWKLYLKNGEGVAIRSTYSRLIKSLSEASEDIYVGTVNYIDYANTVIPEYNAFYPYVHKQKYFSHEQELRAVIQALPSIADKDNPSTFPTIDMSFIQLEKGIKVKTNIDVLIESVYVAPTSADWFYELIQSILEKYKICKAINRSSLIEVPYY